MGNYLEAHEPEHRVAHILPMVAPGPANQIVFFFQLKHGCLSFIGMQNLTGHFSSR